jgi:hypothetical protein
VQQRHAWAPAVLTSLLAASVAWGGPPVVSDPFFGFDLNGDGRADLVVANAATNTVRIQLMDGTNVLATGFVGTGGNTLVGVADLNYDGKSDLLFVNAAGTTMRLNLMNGVTSTSQGFVGNGNGAFPVDVVGDFDGDGNADIAGGTAAIRITTLVGTASTGHGFLGSGGTTLVATGDANDDGRSDLFFDGASSFRINLMDGVTSTSQGFIGNGGGSYGVTLVGDFNADGKVDIGSNGAAFRFSLLDGTTLLGNTFLGGGGFTLRYAGNFAGTWMTDVASQNGGILRLNLLHGVGQSGFLGAGGGTLFP